MGSDPSNGSDAENDLGREHDPTSSADEARSDSGPVSSSPSSKPGAEAAKLGEDVGEGVSACEDAERSDVDGSRSGTSIDDDLFKGLEGLGEELEDTFAQLDRGVVADTADSGDDSAGSSDEPESGPFDALSALLGGLGGSSGFKVIGFGTFGESGNFRSLGGVGGLEGVDELLGQVGRMLHSDKGESAWGGDIDRQARQVSKEIAQGNEPESNVEPTERLAMEQLVRIAEMRVAAVTGLEPARGSVLKIDVVNRTQWADRTIDDYEGLFQALSRSITAGSDTDGVDGENTVGALLAVFSRIMGPTLAGLAAGTMVGRLARRALGSYVLPVPRPEAAPLMLVLPNIDGFGEQWSLSRDYLRLRVCLQEVVYHAVFGVEHVRARVGDLLRRHASAFSMGTARLEEIFDQVDINRGPEQALAEIQATMSDPESLLHAVRSPKQEALQPELTALIAAIVGYADYVTDSVGATLIGPYEQLSEALQRHRAEMSASDRLSERILGFELDQAQCGRGSAFIEGVLAKAGEEGLRRLFKDPADLPTPAEVDAPGLWLARINLPR